MTAPTPRALPQPTWPATTEQMPALPTKQELFLDVITASIEGSAHLNSDSAASRAPTSPGWAETSPPSRSTAGFTRG